MIKIKARMQNELRCELIHTNTESSLHTDAPKNLEGLGENFSPTDLVAGALATCVLVSMGVVAKRHNINLEGTEAEISKQMTDTPRRRIDRLDLVVKLEQKLEEKQRKLLEAAARHCPVASSLHPDTQLSLKFEYEEVS